MTNQIRIVIPESGLTKDQLKEMAKKKLSISYFLEIEGDVLNRENYLDWPDFLFEDVKYPETIEEWMTAEGYNKDTVVEDITRHLKKCHKWSVQNERQKGREERDQEYIEVFEKALNFYNTFDTCLVNPHEIFEDIRNNIKPLDQEDENDKNDKDN